MKIKAFSSPLSCILKCIGFLLTVINKKIILAVAFVALLNGCVQSTAFLGPVYTLGTSGNVMQAGLSYGTSYAVKKVTGKTVSENINTFVDTEELKKELKENSDDFFRIVKKHVKKSNIIEGITSR